VHTCRTTYEREKIFRRRKRVYTAECTAIVKPTIIRDRRLRGKGHVSYSDSDPRQSSSYLLYRWHEVVLFEFCDRPILVSRDRLGWETFRVVVYRVFNYWMKIAKLDWRILMSLNDSYMCIKCHVHFVTALRLHEIRELIMGITRRKTICEAQTRYIDNYLSIKVIFHVIFV